MALENLVQAQSSGAAAVTPAGEPTSLSRDLEVDAAPLSSCSRDPRSPRILAKTIYRELRSGGMSEADVMSLAGELLSLVAEHMRDRRGPPSSR